MIGCVGSSTTYRSRCDGQQAGCRARKRANRIWCSHVLRLTWQLRIGEVFLGGYWAAMETGGPITCLRRKLIQHQSALPLSRSFGTIHKMLRNNMGEDRRPSIFEYKTVLTASLTTFHATRTAGAPRHTRISKHHDVY